MRHKLTAESLLAYGAQKNLGNAKGETPSMWARERDLKPRTIPSRHGGAVGPGGWLGSRWGHVCCTSRVRGQAMVVGGLLAARGSLDPNKSFFCFFINNHIKFIDSS